MIPAMSPFGYFFLSDIFMVADQISSIFWLLHSDVHEARFTAVLEYLSSMVASLEPLHQPKMDREVIWKISL